MAWGCVKHIVKAGVPIVNVVRRNIYIVGIVMGIKSSVALQC